MRRILDFIHKGWLIFWYEPNGRWQTCAGMRTGEIRDIELAPKLWGPDKWILDSREAVRSREIERMLDRGDFGY